jgi:hypothetical protein
VLALNTNATGNPCRDDSWLFLWLGVIFFLRVLSLKRRSLPDLGRLASLRLKSEPGLWLLLFCCPLLVFERAPSRLLGHSTLMRVCMVSSCQEGNDAIFFMLHPEDAAEEQRQINETKEDGYHHADDGEGTHFVRKCDQGWVVREVDNGQSQYTSSFTHDAVSLLPSDPRQLHPFVGDAAGLGIVQGHVR